MPLRAVERYVPEDDGAEYDPKTVSPSVLVRTSSFPSPPRAPTTPAQTSAYGKKPISADWMA